MILGSTIAQEIHEEQFVRLKKSHSILLSARAIEEKYDLLISNYFEFEKELLSKIAEHSLFEQTSYNAFYDLRSILNRRVINLLTSTKLYCDQIEKHVRGCKTITSESFTKPLFSEEYDNHIEYRFLDAMRNHVQHYGLAIHSLTLPSAWTGEGDMRRLVNSIKLFTHKDELYKDSQFKLTTLRELSDKIDLVNAIRVYVNSFNTIHRKIRALIENNITCARDDFDQIIKNYQSINSGDAVGIYAYSVASGDFNEKPNEKFPIMLDWDNVRVRLIKKNQAYNNIHRQYVSSNCL